MNISTHYAGTGFVHNDSADTDVFANFLHQGLARFFNVTARQERDVIVTLLKRRAHHRLNKIEKIFVSGDKISLAVDFNHRCQTAVWSRLNRHNTFGRGSTRFLRRLHTARLTQRLNGRLNITTRLG